MITITFLIILTLIIVGTGFLVALLALLFLNWGPGAAYDYTGNKMLKQKKKRAARRKQQRRR